MTLVLNEKPSVANTTVLDAEITSHVLAAVKYLGQPPVEAKIKTLYVVESYFDIDKQKSVDVIVDQVEVTTVAARKRGYRTRRREQVLLCLKWDEVTAGPALFATYSRFARARRIPWDKVREYDDVYEELRYQFGSVS